MDMSAEEREAVAQLKPIAMMCYTNQRLLYYKANRAQITARIFLQ